jgi:type IV pilus assembly protein PilW
MILPRRTSRFIVPRGWTLVELLVAMALGLLIIAGVGQIYLAAKRSYDIQTSIAEIQDVGRFATEILTQDIRRAGYWGLMDLSTGGLAANTSYAPPPQFPTGDSPADGTCPSGSNAWGRKITEKIFGLNDTAAGYNCLGGKWQRGDVITLRYADPSPVTVYDPDTLYIRTAPLEASVVLGNPANCPTPGSPGCTFIDYVDDQIANTGNYDYRMVAHAYYVTDSTTATECGKAGAPALPALAREELSGGAASPGYPVKQELVNDVEQLQFQYGVDSSGDSSVDQYMNAGAGLNWTQVRSVRFWILVRAD